jgi:hypothetical protein
MDKIKSVPVPPEYATKDVNKDGTRVKGKYPPGIGMKKHIEMRGAGAAERGKKFLDNL